MPPAGNIGEKVSVCLVTYNHVGLIESTLKSVLNQTITGYDIIVSDDCSTDGTWQLILTMAAEHPQIKPVQPPRNLGMAGNANFAVAHSSRPYIALLHHDDLYRRDLLEKWASVLERNRNAAFVFNPYGLGESDRIDSVPMPGECVKGDWFLHERLFPPWGCPVRGTAMIRREAWEQVGGIREQFGMLADVDLWMRLSMRWEVGYVAAPLISVRHRRPDYYPEMYKNVGWSWKRQRFLYEIHAANRLAYLDLWSVSGRLQWWWFRCRLSAETMKWIAYAIVRKKEQMIGSLGDSATQYDLMPLRVIRFIVSSMFPHAIPTPGRSSASG